LKIKNAGREEEKDKWKNSIISHNLKWIQVANMKGFKSEYIKQLRIGGIPF